MAWTSARSGGELHRRGHEPVVCGARRADPPAGPGLRRCAERRVLRTYGGFDQAFGTLCHWVVQLINLVTGNLDRVGGALCTEPAVDLVATTSGGHFNKWQSRVSGRS